MERILTSSQMQNADKYTIEKLGVSQDTLVKRAGRAVYEEITKRYKSGKVLVCIGKGNNGADGLVIAELLRENPAFSVCVLDAFNYDLSVLDNSFDIIAGYIFSNISFSYLYIPVYFSFLNVL